MGWCTVKCKMLLFCVKTVVKESSNFVLAHLKKKMKGKKKEELFWLFDNSQVRYFRDAFSCHCESYWSWKHSKMDGIMLYTAFQHVESTDSMICFRRLWLHTLARTYMICSDKCTQCHTWRHHTVHRVQMLKLYNHGELEYLSHVWVTKENNRNSVVSISNPRNIFCYTKQVIYYQECTKSSAVTLNFSAAEHRLLQIQMGNVFQFFGLIHCDCQRSWLQACTLAH